MNFIINIYVYNLFSYIANNYKSKNNDIEIENLLTTKNQELKTDENDLTDVNDSDSLINVDVEKTKEQIHSKEDHSFNESKQNEETYNNIESNNKNATETILVNIPVCVIYTFFIYNIL